MGNIEFDLIKLKRLCDITVRDAIKHFRSYEEYFVELDKFVKECKYYLSDYTADMIVSSPAEQESFHDDLKVIRDRLISLGITYPVPTLAELDYEARCANKASLAEWLNKFHTELTKMADSINSARVSSSEPEKKEDAPSPSKNQPTLEKPLILAADDKPELLTAVVNMLEDRCRVMAVTSGKAALKIIQKHPPELFLLDIEMPEMNGYELAEKIRSQSRFSETPIIFLTSKNTREDVISAIQKGGSDYLIKPVNKDLLLGKILQHLGWM